MGRRPGWIAMLTGRPAMRSPGRPPVRRDVERRFWVKIAEGLSSEEAAIAGGVSGPVGVRWFRERGGMPSIQLTPRSGRYLSFAEREDIALLSGRGLGVRAIARALGRTASTISRELWRNAATRGGQLDYRASIAQWKAERQSRRPTSRSLAPASRLRKGRGGRGGATPEDVAETPVRTAGRAGEPRPAEPRSMTPDASRRRIRSRSSPASGARGRASDGGRLAFFATACGVSPQRRKTDTPLCRSE
jgi:transposase-like protein